MVSMDQRVTPWYERGRGTTWTGLSFHDTLKGINDAVRQADRRLAAARGMIGIGYYDRTGLIADIGTDLGTISAYVDAMANDIAALDQKLFEAFANGPTQTISNIRAEDITTPNTLGVTGDTTYTTVGENPMTYTQTFVKDKIAFADFTGPDVSGSTIEFFPDIFQASYTSWQAAEGSDLDLSQYIAALLSSGEFTHEAYHPIGSFVSTVLDVTGVWAIYKAIAGYDPITRETLSAWQRGLEAGMGIIDLIAILAAIPTGGATVEGAAWLRTAAAAALKTLIVNAIATGASVLTFNTAIDLGLPTWAATLLALGVGFTISIAGTKYIIHGPSGEPIGEPIDIATSEAEPGAAILTGHLPPTGKPNSFGYDADGNLMPYANSRPGYTRFQIRQVWENSKEPVAGFKVQQDGSHFDFQAGDVVVRDIDGNWYKVEWDPSQPGARPWDMGHFPEAKYADLRARYLNHEISREQFLAEFQDPAKYHVEDPLRNRSHVDE